MAEKIVIEIVGNADDFIADVKKATAATDSLNKNLKVTGASADGLDSVRAQFAGLQKEIDGVAVSEKAAAASSGMLNKALLGAAATVAVAVVGAVVTANNAFVEYGDSVYELSKRYDISTESASRFLTVSEKLGKTPKELEKALMAVKKNGLDPASDGYKALANELGVTETAFRSMNSEVRDGVVLSDEMATAAHEQASAIAEMKEAWNEFSMVVGAKVAPAITNVLFGFARSNELMEEQIRLRKEGLPREEAMAQALINVKAAVEGTDDAQYDLNITNENAIDPIKAIEEGLKREAEEAKRLTGIFKGLISTMFTIQSGNEKYADTIEGITKKDEELTNKKNILTLAMWEEEAAGKQTAESYLKYVQQLNDITLAQEENAKARTEAAEDVSEESDKRVYDLTQQRLAADGVIDSGEYEYLQNLAVNMGLVSRAAADQAVAESKRADALANSFAQTEPIMRRDLELLGRIFAYDGMTAKVGLNYSSGSPSFYPQTTPGVTGSRTSARTGGRSRDSGGSGMAGQPYYIGTGAQPELFTPSTNGTFTPNADKLGATYNVNIYNPVTEKSENSIRKSLKSLSFVGSV